MRVTRIFDPLPAGKGFFMGRVVLLAAIVAATAIPASAAVNVTLDVSAGEPLANAGIKRCSVSVAAGADGAAVLDRAVATGCISSWSGSTFSGGTYVDCIDGICGNAALYWRMTENGTLTTYGIDAFRANAGDVLGFSYAQWVTCFPVEIAC